MKNNKGFTLVELVVVIAILGILAGIAVPRFMETVELSRETTDIANVRNALSKVSTAAAMHEMGQAALPEGVELAESENSKTYYTYVQLTQSKTGWQSALPINIANIKSANADGTEQASSGWIGEPQANGICSVWIKDGEAQLRWDGNKLSAIPGVSVVKGEYWKGDGNKDAVAAKDPSRNRISPVTLSSGDSFFIPFSLIAENGTGGANNKLGFFLTKKNEGVDTYETIVDSGWLSKTNYKGNIKTDGKPTRESVYTVTTEADGFRVTVKQDGITLLFNSWQASNNVENIFNGVSVDRAK